MARLFDNALTEYLTYAAAIKNAAPFALVSWFNSNDEANPQCLIGIGGSGDNGNYFMLIARGDVGNVIQVYVGDDGLSATANTSSGYTVDTWHHGCAIFASPTDRRVLIDGGSKGTSALDRTPTAGNLDRTAIGILDRAAPYAPMSGLIAEAAIYDLSVWPGATNADKANNFEKILPSLAKGFTPLHFPLGLVAYWPLVRGLNDKVGGFNLTANGTVVAAQPRIIQPHRPL